MKPIKSDFDEKILRAGGQTSRSHVSGLQNDNDSLISKENHLEVGTSIQGVNPNNLNITQSEIQEL